MIRRATAISYYPRMPYAPHALVQFGGALASVSGPSEQWSCTVRVWQESTPGSGTGGFLTDPAGYLAAIVTPLQNWITTSTNKVPGDVTLTYIKANNINSAGHYNEPTTHQIAASALGAAVAQGVPAFCCVAFTWETGLARGKAHRGRVYTPNYGYKVQAGSQLGSTDASAAAQSGKNLLTALTQNVLTPTAYRVAPVVASSSGAINRVTGVSVDNIYDVQRRRKNHLTGTRSATLAFP